MTDLERKLSNLLEKFVDEEECQFDHHGYCQTHLVDKPCTVDEARKLLKDICDHDITGGWVDGKQRCQKCGYIHEN